MMLAENLLFVGMVFVFVGILLLITSIFLSARERKKAEGGFVIFIGPIPIVGATTKMMFYAMLAVSTILLLVFLLMKFY